MDSNTQAQEHQSPTNEEQQDQSPLQVTHTHGVLTIVITLITDIQDYVYADGTEEQVGNQRAELRITLDRDTYVDDYTRADDSGNEEQVDLPSSRTATCKPGQFRSRSH